MVCAVIAYWIVILRADLEFASHFRVRVAREFPFVLPFHHHDFRVREFDDRSGDLVGIRLFGKCAEGKAEGGGECEKCGFVPWNLRGFKRASPSPQRASPRNDALCPRV